MKLAPFCATESKECPFLCSPFSVFFGEFRQCGIVQIGTEFATNLLHLSNRRINQDECTNSLKITLKYANI